MKFSWLSFALVLLTSCSSSVGGENPDPTDPPKITYNWIVPTVEVVGNFSPFPLAENPSLFLASDIDFISDDTKVALISFGDEVRIYPYNYVHSFEVVNDAIGNREYAITYCPITSSTVGFNRDFGSNNFTIRASGYLYKENQVLHDNATDSFWSQMELRCIKGVFQGENIQTFNIIETTWKTAKNYFPDGKVFTNASVSKSSNQKTSKKPDNNDPIYGILESNGKDGTIHAFGFGVFNNNTITVKKESIEGKQILVIGSTELSFITSYINNEQVDFFETQGEFPIIMEDSNGNIWNVFGIATSGPRKGQQLNSPRGFFASWWAWESFYTKIDVKE